ncbi:MAG: carbonate dehydratase [Candidatus Eisenbacteria bacterium]
MRELDKLFDQNRAWADRVRRDRPQFFRRLSEQQRPAFLWIGCSDSRVPANEIVDLEPGELFVHRNVANVVVHTDLNCLSVLQYAVDVLQVRHVIVCGHYGCGGVAAAVRGVPLGLVDNWLRHIQDVGERHRTELDSCISEEAKVDRLCELNVIQQAANVCRTSIALEAWRRGQPLAVHGWIYGLEDGLLRDLGFCVESAEKFTGEVARVVAGDSNPS